jgi:hypothetical protein
MLALSSRNWCGRWTLVIPVLFAGCGWQHTMTFRSPSRKAAIEIWQKGIDNSGGARVELVTAKGRTVLYRVPKGVLYLLCSRLLVPRRGQSWCTRNGIHDL